MKDQVERIEERLAMTSSVLNTVHVRLDTRFHWEMQHTGKCNIRARTDIIKILITHQNSIVIINNYNANYYFFISILKYLDKS